MNLPIIQLSVESMKHTVSVALMQHQAQMDSDIQAAVERYCTPENIGRVIQRAATSALEGAIKAEVDAFFRYGAGRQAVAAAVKESILKKETYTRLDHVDDLV